MKLKKDNKLIHLKDLMPLIALFVGLSVAAVLTFIIELIWAVMTKKRRVNVNGVKPFHRE
jgi:hypothetical protein